jgi:rod shape-determining protein MreC
MFSKQTVIAIGGVILIVCCIILLSLSNKNPKATDGVEGVPVSFISPLQNTVTGSIRFVRDIWSHYFYLASTARENKQLRKALKQALEENFKCTETELANQRLRKFINFQKTKTGQVIAAEVIGKDPSPWFHAVIIDKGEDDGIIQGLPVVNADGIIGQVMAATAGYAKVLLMTDRNSAVDSLVQRSRARGITKGNSTDQCRLQYVLRKNDVRVGDIVISSGLDGVYPKGLRIGHVSRLIRRNAGIFQEVEVTPFVDFEKLEEVLVVLTSNGNGSEEK